MRPDFDSMNETDVREIIVRPLLHRLGYAHGTQANIRTEVPLRYDRAFLGRKKPTKDPPLAGRADYICDAVSYGRWVVEAKAPSQDLSQDDVEQAHTYCAHPEIAAAYFLLTNGREFRLYAIGRLSEPILAWNFDEIDERLMTLFNVVGYEAVKRLAKLVTPDPAKPLGPGLPSSVRIVGGQVRYGEHYSDHPLVNMNAMEGTVGGVTGIKVARAADGRLHATVRMISPYQQLAELNRLAGIEDFEFYCAEEFISVDIRQPTIFQNVVQGRLDPGARGRLWPGTPELTLPVGFQHAVVTEATGYMDGDTFRGILAFDYQYQLIRGPRTGNPQLDRMLSRVPSRAQIRGSGEFDIVVSRE